MEQLAGTKQHPTILALEKLMSHYDFQLLRCADLMKRRSWAKHSDRYRARYTRRYNEAAHGIQRAQQRITHFLTTQGAQS